MLNTAGKQVRSARGRLGWSLHKASQACGVNPSTLWKVEKGKSQPNASTASKIETGLGLPSGSLLDAPERPTAPERDDSDTASLIPDTANTDAHRGDEHTPR